ncbi:MAG: hypothetical protein GY861_15630 [bacterium]|nr:hypothetical protein [bacterium]
MEEVDSSDEEKSDSENQPLIQYAPKAKETTVQRPVLQEQKDEVKKQIAQAPVKAYNLRSQKI